MQISTQKYFLFVIIIKNTIPKAIPCFLYYFLDDQECESHQDEYPEQETENENNSKFKNIAMKINYENLMLF